MTCQHHILPCVNGDRVEFCISEDGSLTIICGDNETEYPLSVEDSHRRAPNPLKGH